MGMGMGLEISVGTDSKSTALRCYLQRLAAASFTHPMQAPDAAAGCRGQFNALSLVKRKSKV